MGMAFAISTEMQFITEACYKCGIVFAVDKDLQANWRRDKTQFYCPNGHPQSYITSEADRLRKELEDANRAAAWHRSRADNLDKQLIAQKGIATKLKKRIGAGVCPCCHRTFKQLAAHMQGKHPDYAAGQGA